MNRRLACTAVGCCALASLLLACSDDSSDRSSGATAETAAAAASSIDDSTGVASTPKATVPGLSDDKLIAAAVAALGDAGETVGSDREPVLKRSDTTAEVSFPTRLDLDPVIGGEPHVYLDPVTGIVLRISHTR